jgi:hypothetical protein
MSTKKKAAVRISLAAVIGLGCSAVSAEQDRTCSPFTLRGTYVFNATGWGTPPGSTTMVPKAILELIELNGDGTLSVPAATLANRLGDGQVVPAPPNGTGQYALDPMCTGTLSFHNGPSFNIVVSPKGDDLWMIQTNPGNVFQGSLTRLSR